MGLFCLVLHTHLPYLRRNGVWPVGEDLFHQAAAESYLPLLTTFERLAARGVRDAFTLGLSPMIATQLEDPYLLDELGWWLGRYEPRALHTAANYGRFDPHESPPLAPREVRALAGWYALWARAQIETLDRVRANGGGIASAFASLARDGLFEILGGPATHPLLARIAEPSLQRLQLDAGLAEASRLLGARPGGIWLPECHFAPDAGLESLLDGAVVTHLVLDGPTVQRTQGKDATFQPWRIKGGTTAAFGRNLDVTYRVWSPTGGYPAGPWYRDFFGYDLVGGFKNWRVTSVRVPLHEKGIYEPARAVEAARADARDFAAFIAHTLRAHRDRSGRDGVVVAAYDTELFGHWWFEGPLFLEELFIALEAFPEVRATSLRTALSLLPEPEPATFEEGSWGFRKDLRSWLTPETAPMLDALAAEEHATVRFVRDELPGADGARIAALDQLVRETMLLQASDWPFKIVRGRNPGYAHERFATHRARIQALRELVRSRIPADLVARDVAEMREIDDVLPDVRAAALLA